MNKSQSIHKYFNLKRNFVYFLPFISCILIIGCSTSSIIVPLNPIERDKRIKVQFFPLEDMTGVYDKANIHFEDIIPPLLDSNFIRTIEYSRKKKSYILVTKQNPFMSCSYHDTTCIAVMVKGVVEMCSYEKQADIKDLIAKYHFLGLLSLLTNSDDSDPCGYIQIRIKVLDYNGKQIFKTIAIGVSSGDIYQYSRKELINKAIVRASQYFYEELIEQLTYIYKLQPLVRKEEISDEEAEKIRANENKKFEPL